MRRRGPATIAAFLVLAALASDPRALRAGPPEEGCQELLRQAALLIARAERTGDVGAAREAAERLDRAGRLCPQDPDIPFRQSVASVLARDAEGARAAKRRLEAVLVERVRALNRPEAEAAVDARPHYLEALFHYRFDGRPKEALEELAKVQVLDPSFLPASVATVAYWCHLGYASQLVDAAAYEKAADEVRLAILAARGDGRREDGALRRLAAVLRLAGHPADAQKAWENLLSRYPNDAVVRYGLAASLTDQGKDGPAAEAWKEAVRVAALPGSVDPREADQVADAPMRYGVSLVRAGRLDDGQARLEEYAKGHPQDARPWFHLGRLVLQRGGDPAKAAEDLEKARALDPSCERTLRALLDLYSGPRPDAERAKALKATLDSPEDQAARQREMARRLRTRPDRTDGCE